MRIYFFTLLFSISNLIAFSQGRYIPLPDSNASWRTDWYAGDNCPMQSCPYQSYQYTLSGDTFISGMKWHKVYESGIQTCLSSVIDFGPNYVAAIRQDSEHRKVFIWRDYPYNDTFLYDFNLKVGDTLPETYINSANTYVVDSIDSVKISGVFHRSFYIGINYVIGPPSIIEIEGIGNVSTGFLENFAPVTDPDIWKFVCFSENGIFEYGDTSNCSLILGVNKVIQSNNIKVFPTICLAREPFHISIPDYSLRQKPELTIYRSDGSLIKNISSNELKNENSISLFNCSSGIYFYSLHSSKQVLKSGTFIIQ